MRRLDGRVATVTGAASGIGRATSVALARAGCHLALADVDEAGIAETARAVEALGRKASTHVADVADRTRVRALAEEVVGQHGHVHVLVNNAGVAIGGAVEDVPDDDFEWIVGVNFWGVVHGCQAFLPLLRREDEAHIVNVSSVFGIVAPPYNAPYCATKFAVRGFTEALWGELRGSQVGVTVVHPGGVRTNIVRRGRFPDEEQRREATLAFERMARTRPEAVARRIVRAIERNRMRLRVCPETFVLDWLKRLFPIGTQRLLGLGSARLDPGARAAHAGRD